MKICFFAIVITVQLCGLAHMTTTGCDDVVSNTDCTCEVAILYQTTSIVNINCSGMDKLTIPKTFPNDLLSIDFSNNFLVPDDIHELCNYDLYSVSLASNHITKIPDDQFKRCNNLTILDMGDNEIDNLTATSLNGLHSLVSLVGIEAGQFEQKMFSNLTYLKNLKIVIRQSIIPVDLFYGLNLEKLELDIRRALELPGFLFNGLSDTLNTLSISSNRLQLLKQQHLAKLGALTTFNLSCSSIRQLPYTLFEHNHNLTTIRLVGMASIPRNIFTGLDQLLSLTLHGLEDMPSELFLGMFQLKSLDVSKCPLARIPDSWFQDLYNLSVLRLRENGLEKLNDDDFKNLHSLKVLDLSGNRIRELINGVIVELAETIEVVILSNNVLTNINAGNFEEALHLVTLDLSNNYIHTVGNGAFEDLYSLQTLTLAYNKLDDSDIQADLFKTNTKLTNLNLAANILTRIPDGLLGQMRQLKTLDLSLNSIKHFGPNSHDTSELLLEIDFSTNPVVCDCDLYTFIQGMPQTRVLGECSTPDYSVIPISDFTPSQVCEKSTTSSTTTTASTTATLKPSLPTTTISTSKTVEPTSSNVESTSSTVKSTSSTIESKSSAVLNQTVDSSSSSASFSSTPVLSSSEQETDSLESQPTSISTTFTAISVNNETTATSTSNVSSTEITLETDSDRYKPQPIRMSTVAPTQSKPNRLTEYIPIDHNSRHISSGKTTYETTTQTKTKKPDDSLRTQSSRTSLVTTKYVSAENTKQGIRNNTTTKSVDILVYKDRNESASFPTVHPNVTLTPGEKYTPVTEESRRIAIISIVGVTVACVVIILALVYKRRWRSRYEVSRALEDFPDGDIIINTEINPLKDVPSITIETVDAMDNVKVEVYKP